MLVSPDEYAALKLPDQFIEDCMQAHEVAWLLENTKKGERILDLGWGSGIVATALQSAGRSITLAEGSQEFCKQAYRFVDSIIYSKFEDIALAETFDTVIASFVLEHVEDPMRLLMKCRELANRLIVVVGNANSYHRQLAVKMGLQERLDSLSDRDKAVGHYRVYGRIGIEQELLRTGWRPQSCKGLMFKPLPNGMLKDLPLPLIEAMCGLEVDPETAGNLGIVCQKL